MEPSNAVDEDWELLRSFFPADRLTLGFESGALRGWRQDKSAETLLRLLLLQVGGGYSLRETVVRARAAPGAELSDGALLKRLRKSQAWLSQLGCALWRQRGVNPGLAAAPALRLVDSTLVQEPGPTGSLWRLHYSFQWPTLARHFPLGFRVGSVDGRPARGVNLAWRFTRSYGPLNRAWACASWWKIGTPWQRRCASPLGNASRKRRNFSKRVSAYGVTRWRWPPERACGLRSSILSSPSALEVRPTISEMKSFFFLASCNPKAMLLKMVMWGYKA
jgi:hypothetical protein